MSAIRIRTHKIGDLIKPFIFDHLKMTYQEFVEWLCSEYGICWSYSYLSQILNDDFKFGFTGVQIFEKLMYDEGYKIDGKDLPLRFYFWIIKKRVKFKELDKDSEKEIIDHLIRLCNRLNNL